MINREYLLKNFDKIVFRYIFLLILYPRFALQHYICPFNGAIFFSECVAILFRVPAVIANIAQLNP